MPLLIACQKSIMSGWPFLLNQFHPLNFARHGTAATIIL